MKIHFHRDGTVSYFPLESRAVKNTVFIVDALFDGLSDKDRVRLARHLRVHKWVRLTDRHLGSWRHPLFITLNKETPPLGYLAFATTPF